MKRLIFIAAACLMMTACTTTRIVEVERVRTDTTYITKQQRDSIWLHDSIHVKERGDTVLIERWHTKYRERLKTDTLIEHRVDSVPVPYPVERLVEKPLSKIETGLMGLGILSLMGLVVFVAFKVKKFLP